MKLRLLFPLFLSIFLIGLGCQQSSKKASPQKTAAHAKKVSKGGKAAKVKSKKKYWRLAKKAAGLSNGEIKNIQAINKKYAAKIKTLNKSKKWAGNANKATRVSTGTAKQNEIRRMLGSKAKAFDKFNRKWNANLLKARKKAKAGKK